MIFLPRRYYPRCSVFLPSALGLWWWVVDKWTARLDVLEHGGCACGGAVGHCALNDGPRARPSRRTETRRPPR